MGINETKEALVATLELTILLSEILKDGVQTTDAITLYAKVMGDEDLKAKFFAAYDNYKNIPAEVSDIDVTESVDLVVTTAGYVPRILAALKK